MRKSITLFFFLFICFQTFSQNLFVLSIEPYNCDGIGNNKVSFTVSSNPTNVTYNLNVTYNWKVIVNGVLQTSGSDIGIKKISVNGTNYSIGDDIIVVIQGTGNYNSIPSQKILNVTRITTYNTPNIAPIINSSTNIICDGKPVNLSLSGDPANTFTWYNSSAQVNPVNPFTFDVFVAGNYSVKESNVCGISPVSNIITLTTSSTPSAPIASASGNTICDGNSIILTATGTGGTYNWSNNTNGVTTNVNNSGGYTVTETNSCGTSSPSNTITLTSLVTPIVEPITGTMSVCVSSTVQLSNATNNGLWSTLDPNKVSINQNGIVTGVTPGNVIIKYSVSNICGTGFSQANILIISTVPNSPIITIPKTLLCNGESTIISSSVPNGGGEIFWNNNQKGNNINIVQSGNYKAFETNACGNSNFSNIIIVTTSATPSAPIASASSNTICDGNNVVLTVTGSGGTYNWSNNTTGVTTNANKVGNYTVTETNSCGTSSPSNTLTLTSLITPIVKPITGIMTVCVSSTVQLSDSTNNGVWSSLDNNKVIVSQSGLVTGKGSGIGVIKYSVTNICGTGVAQADILVNSTVPNSPSILSPKTVLCNGDSTVISSSVPSGGGQIFWNNNQMGINLNVTNAGVYKAFETNACGNSNFSNIIKIDTLSTPIVEPIIGNSSVCNGSQIALSNLTIGGTWKSLNDSIASVDFNGVVTGKKGNTSTIIKYTVSNSCGTISKLKTINIDTLPVINIASKLNGSKVELIGEGALVYNWNSGDSTAKIEKPINISKTFTLIGTDSRGCSASKNFIVDAIPNNATTFITSTLGEIYCTGDSTILTLTQGSSYYWDNGESTQKITTSKAGIHTGAVLYSLLYKVETAAITISNYSVPTVDPINESNTITYCNNTNAPSIVFSGPIAGTSFKWTNDNSFAGIQPSGVDKISSFFVTNLTNSSIVVNFSVIPTANGCIGPVYNFKTIMNPTPYLTNEKVFNICDGSYFQFVPKINLNSAFNIVWNVIKDDSTNLSNTPTSGSILSKLQNNSTNIRKIKFVGTLNSLGCTNNDTLKVNIIPNPFGVLSATNNTIKSGKLDTFYFQTTDTIPQTYLWNLGFNIPLINTTKNNYNISYHHTTDTLNIINLVVTNSFGCINSFNKIINIIGVPDTIPMNSVDSNKWVNTLLPVPFNDHLSFRYHLDKDESANFSFFDTGGFPLYEIKVQLYKGYHQIEIPELWRIKKNKLYLFICNSPSIYFKQIFYGINF